jgi:hypothetical protein
MTTGPQRTVPPSIKYTTKELLEKIEQKVDALHDIRSKWGLLLAFLAIVLGFSGLGKWWDYATIDALKTRIGAQDAAIADLKHRLELHANEAGHGDIKCYTAEDTEQDKRIQSIERKLRRR